MNDSSKSRLSRAPRYAALIAAVLAAPAFTSEAHAQAAPAAPPSADEPRTVETQPLEAPSAAPIEPAPAPPPVEPAPEPVVNADADADAAAAAAAIEAELAAGAVATTTSSNPALNLYGFADFTYATYLTKYPYGIDQSSFSVGNLNVYLNAELGQNWRSLSEVRFTYLPHGATVLDPATFAITRPDTTVADYSDLGRPTRIGGIEIERVWLEYSPHELLTIRGGQWLTPYGIWNVDHGSPVIIGVRKPYIIGESLFPERQTGLELYGSLYVKATQLGYHLTLSNGRGPVDAYQDFDGNKAVGARLFLKNDSLLGNITVGVSGYKGTFTNSVSETAFSPSGEPSIKEVITQQYDELSLAADVKWEWQDFLVQGEVILNDVAYREGSARPQDPGLTGGPPGWVPDSRRHGLYGIAAYRTPLLNLMPFFGGEYYRIGAQNPVPDSAAIWGGLNMRVIPSVVLKAQYTHSWRPSKAALTFLNEKINVLEFQAAWSF